MLKLTGALIQHGPLSARIYLMKGCPGKPRPLIDKLRALADRRGYGKIFAKVPARLGQDFLAAGFCREATIPDFYPGGEAAWFLGLYPLPTRAREKQPGECEQLITMCRKQARPSMPRLPPGLRIRHLEPGDSQAMAAIYREVFPTYPFPIDNPGYLEQTMGEHIDYFAVTTMGRLLALASAEKDNDAGNVEMTDFATLANWRGLGFAGHLLQTMEKNCAGSGFRLAYTIARARSAGINLTFARAGYHYAGRLRNNTNISGHIESMNVWYKRLGETRKSGGVLRENAPGNRQAEAG